MGKRKAPEYPHFDVGQKVKLLKDIIRWPFIPGHGYGDPYVFVPAGEIGTISKPLSGSNYTVNFPQCGNIMRYALNLEPIEEGEADPEDTKPLELPVLTCPRCSSTNWRCYNEYVTQFEDIRSGEEFTDAVGQLVCNDCGYDWENIPANAIQLSPDSTD